MFKEGRPPFLLKLVYIGFLSFATRLIYPLSGKELCCVCGSGGVQRNGEDGSYQRVLPLSLIKTVKSVASRYLGGFGSSSTGSLGVRVCVCKSQSTWMGYINLVSSYIPLYTALSHLQRQPTQNSSSKTRRISSV